MGYIFSMRKTQIKVYLDSAQIERLRAESAKTGVSVAELIRRAINTVYSPQPATDNRSEFDKVFGV